MDDRLSKVEARQKQLSIDLDWSYFDSTLKEALVMIHDGYDELVKKVKANTNAYGTHKPSYEEAIRQVFVKYDYAFGARLGFLHRVICGLDTDGNHVGQTVFQAHEAKHQVELDLASPEAYFNSREEFYLSLATTQRKCAALAAMRYRLGDIEEDISELKSNLEKNLIEQYNVFLKDMPKLATLCAMSHGYGGFDANVLYVRGSAGGAVKHPTSTKHEELVPIHPGWPFGTIHKETGFSSYSWRLVQVGSSDKGATFGIVLKGTWHGASDMWTVYFGDPVKKKTGYTLQQQPKYEKIPLLSVGRPSQKHKVTGDIFPLLSAQTYLDAVYKAKNADKTVFVDLAMTVPTERDLANAKLSNRKIDPLGDLTRSVTTDRLPAMVLSDQTKTGAKGHELYASAGIQGDADYFSYSSKKVPVDEKANYWDSKRVVLQIPDIDLTPPPAENPKAVLRRDLKFEAGHSDPVWRPGYKVRYFVQSFNRVEVQPKKVLVPPPDGMKADSEGYFGDKENYGFIISVPLQVSPSPNLAEGYRVYRQFLGESEATEIASAVPDRFPGESYAFDPPLD